MLAMEEILCELGVDDMNEQGLPPGFRFHPTDEELITFYLASKVLNGSFCGVDVAEVDLNRCEPWELPDAAKMGEREWYFFSLRDRKYPTGLRTNRATSAGYWKATGKDREVYSTGSSGGALVGMKKTLVFYKGRAPRGEKTKWIMHEYRLDADFFHRHTCKEEWVICRIFHKIGEKKNLLLQGQSHLNLIKTCSPPSAGLLPPLLEAPTTLVGSQSQEAMQSLQNPLLIHHHRQETSYLKSAINPVFSHCNLLPIRGSPPSFPPTRNTITASAGTNKDADECTYLSPTPSLIKYVLNGQTLKEATNAVSKQCNTEASFPCCQSSNDNMPWAWADKTRPSTTDRSLALPPTTPFWADFLGYPSASDAVREMPVSSSTSVAVSRAGFQTLLDPPIADSWSVDF